MAACILHQMLAHSPATVPDCRSDHVTVMRGREHRDTACISSHRVIGAQWYREHGVPTRGDDESTSDTSEPIGKVKAH